MKIIVEKCALIEALSRVQGPTAAKSTMPVLANVLVEPNIERQILMITGTDLELSVWTRCAAKIESSESFTVPAKRLLDIVKELPQDAVSLELADNRLRLKSGRSKFELATIPPGDFPLVEFPEDAEFKPFDAQLVRLALNQTQHAMPGDNDSFSVAGMFVHSMGDDLRFVASDGHRLAYSEAPFPISAKDGIIIPRKGIMEILKLTEKTEKAASPQVAMAGTSLCFKFEDTLLSVQLIEANFPEYQMIIPNVRNNSIHLPKNEMISAVRRVGVMADGKWRHLTMKIGPDLVELMSGGGDSGQGSDAIDIDYSGEEFKVSFNLKYVLDAIGAVDGESVRFEWVDQFHGGVFCGSNDRSISLIMPMVI